MDKIRLDLEIRTVQVFSCGHGEDYDGFDYPLKLGLPRGATVVDFLCRAYTITTGPDRPFKDKCPKTQIGDIFHVEEYGFFYVDPAAFMRINLAQFLTICAMHGLLPYKKRYYLKDLIDEGILEKMKSMGQKLGTWPEKANQPLDQIEPMELSDAKVV